MVPACHPLKRSETGSCLKRSARQFVSSVWTAALSDCSIQVNGLFKFWPIH